MNDSEPKIKLNLKSEPGAATKVTLGPRLMRDARERFAGQKAEHDRFRADLKRQEGLANNLTEAIIGHGQIMERYIEALEANTAAYNRASDIAEKSMKLWEDHTQEGESWKGGGDDVE